jgi:methionyl aminopeptidase
MIAKTEDEIKNLRKAGKILAGVLRELVGMVKEGVSTAELDLMAEKLIREQGAEPAFLGYKPEGATFPYPATLCVSIDDEVVHGIPSAERLLKNGELVMLDLGLSYNGYFSDAATTVCVGGLPVGSDDASNTAGQRLIEATREASREAIKAAVVGGHVGDIGAAVMRVAQKYNLGIVEDLGGHGIGRVPHEKPYISNVGKEGKGEKLVEGLVIAIEPILTEGKGDVYLADDEWTYKTKDGSRSAEIEHTVLLTKEGPEILTA